MERLRNLGLSLGLVGALAGGCKAPKSADEYNRRNWIESQKRSEENNGVNWDLLTEISLKAIGINKGNGAAIAVGDGFIASGAAKSGRSEVRQEFHVHANRKDTLNEPTYEKRIEAPREFVQQNVFYTFEYFKGDMNNNGTADSSEFAGFMRKEFKKGEKFRIGCHIHNRRGAELTIKISKENGTYSRPHIITKSITSNSFPDATIVDSSKLSFGPYSFSFYIGSEKLGNVGYEITKNE